MKLITLLMFLLLATLFQLQKTRVAAYNFCNNKSHLCDTSSRKHFVCQLEEELRPLNNKAKYVGTIPDTVGLRNLILDYHNGYRNKVAGGELKTNFDTTFQAATRMREVIWDTELAYMARLHAATVSFKHTECRAVTRFPYVGENLGLVFPSSEPRTIKEVLNLTLNQMFEEYLEVENPYELISDFDLIENAAGHFTVIVSDRVSRIGCGIAVATHCVEDNKEGYCHFLTCHYDFTNVVSSYVYEYGEKASNCKVWNAEVSTEYPNLCTNDGTLFHKEHDEVIWDV